MCTKSLKCVIALASFVVAGTAPGPAHATPGECQRVITRDYPDYVRTTLRALQRCEDNIARGRAGYPVGLDCRTEFFTMQKIEQAETLFREHVNSACGGNNHTCNAGDTGSDADETLASIGWNIDACPDLEGSGCTNAISDCNDIVDCLFCTTNAAQSQALALYYHALNLPPADRALGTCQRRIGKAAVDFFWKKLKKLETCERKVRSGDLPGPCPDATTQQHIDGLEASMHANICSKCGGADRLCGGAADRTPTEIGFTSECPSVTIPGGAACGAITISDIATIATCVECVTEFKADCLDALSVPDLRPYPAECPAVP